MQDLMLAGFAPCWEDYASNMPNLAWRDIVLWKEAEIERGKKG